jgi:hypothetical protein
VYVPLRVPDHQCIDGATPDHAAADGTEPAAVDRAEAERADDQQIVVTVVRLVDQRSVVLALEGPRGERHTGLVACPLRLVEIGIGDDRKPACDQVVVNVALPLEFPLLAKLFRQTAFHLAEAQVVHLRREHVRTGDPGIRARRRDTERGRGAVICVIGGIQCKQDRTITCRFCGRLDCVRR